MKPAALSFLKDLLQTASPSGWEQKIQRKWLAYVKPYADKITTDAYGNVVATLNPTGSPHIAIAGHSDEIGFMVQYISDEGFISLTTIGGVDHALALGQRVVIHGAKGEVRGVIGSLAIHLQDRSKDRGITPLHELYVDVGASSSKDLKGIVEVGDPVIYDAGPFELLNHTLVARALDNRVGIFAAAQALVELSKHKKKLKACVHIISTIQEENGLYGACMVAGTLPLDAAIAIDVGHATDIPMCDAKKFGKVKLGLGPVLSRGSANHPVLVDRLKKVASSEEISIQWGTDPRFSSTDADEFFRGRGGVPSAVVSVPNRYMHSPVEMIHLEDLEKTSALCTAFALDLKKGESFAHRLL